MKQFFTFVVLTTFSTFNYAQSLCFDPASDNRYETTSGCSDVGIIDVDGDGIEDVLAVSGGNFTSYSKGLGNGTFAQAIELPYSGGSDLMLVDTNNDGDLDIVRYSSGFMNLSINNGNGTFAVPVSANVNSITNPTEIAVGDVTGDGYIDFVINDKDQDLIHIFKGTVAGLIGDSFSIATSDKPTNVQVGNIDADNIDDIVCSYDQLNQITIYTALGGENFSVENIPISATISSGLASIEIGDLTGDGVNEVMIAGLTQLIVLTEVNGSIETLDEVFMGAYAYGSIIGDWNNDGALDVAWANNNLGGITVNLNSGDGTFESQTNFLISSGGASEELAAADMNNDGNLDIIVANGFDANFAYLEGHGDGTFGAQNLLTGYSSEGFAAEDFDNDGDIDVVATNNGSIISSFLSVSLNNGDGTFQDTNMIPNIYGSGECLAIHIDNDNNLDLAIHTSIGYAIRLGNGDGTFDTEVLFETNNMNAGGERPIASGDFNGDGDIDLAGARPGSNTVSVVLGNGNASFGAPILLEDIEYPRTLHTADLNNDGRSDLIVCANTIDEVWIYFGNTNGSFSAPLVLNAVGNPQGLTTFDANEDGITDLIVASPNANKLYTFISNNNGTFQNAIESIITTNSNCNGLDYGDINQDDHLDVVGAFYQTNEAGVFFGNGDGSFQPAITYAMDSSPTKVMVADFNNDGALDFSSLNTGINNISVVLNNSAFITANGSLAFCVGESVQLNSSSGYSYLWNTGAESQSIVATEAGEYYCAITNQSGTCTINTPTVMVEVFQGQDVTLDLENSIVCADGEDFFLSGGFPFGGQYTGDGIVANVFDPATVSIGEYEVTYTYQDAGSCTNASATDIIVVNICDNIYENANRIAVFPTITSDFVTLSGCQNKELQMIDSNGRIVLSKTTISSSEIIDVATFASGIYTLRIFENGELEVIRIVVE